MIASSSPRAAYVAIQFMLLGDVHVGGHVDVNANAMLDNGADNAGPNTGTQQDALRRGAMNQLREVLADDMWDIYQRFSWYKFT
ncbi:hypothetical protein TIFTF001_008001 [Ficus carica]|uniref:Uncharacterized protein n=1 Tax=Ficus carica TaxID=3494 RepID=A0AA87ZS91_FICCA|nr:hypothetical protein TIFTF001_008001 [Ficus carica]